MLFILYSSNIMNHRDIIGLWPSIAEFARDLGLSSPFVTAYAWHRRGSIPHEYWSAVITSAKDRKFKGITLATLSESAPARRKKAA